MINQWIDMLVDQGLLIRLEDERLGRPEEIAALVAFIVSESAGFMTGSNVSMNGGQHMY